MNPLTLDRRAALLLGAQGLGTIALAGMLAEEASAQVKGQNGLHHPAKAKRVLQLFMNGGVSQMDTFDYKPELIKRHGQQVELSVKIAATSLPGPIMKSPFEWKQHGQSGRWVTSVFPKMAKHVDELAFLMAMESKTNVHGPGSYLQNTGFVLPGFPCLGAWVGYALGKLTDRLPTFVVMPDARGLPYNGTGNFSAGFLPASHQGTVINPASATPIPDLRPHPSMPWATPTANTAGLGLLAEMNREHALGRPGDTRLTARIESYEMAAQMQLHASEAFDLTRETNKIHDLYGTARPGGGGSFARNCLLARRLIERDVRFVQVWSGAGGPANNWDNHGNIPTELPAIAQQVDQPIAALLNDLRARGLLDDTLVIFTTEFGRMPFTQGSVGRDHNGGTFVSWLAGAGIKPGVAHGQSDEFSLKAAQGKTTCYDLHATILHLLGIDHEKLTVRHNGIDRRLTDVHGHVISEILA